MDEITMAKDALPWEWIVEKLSDFKDVSVSLLKDMIMHIPDINRSSCSSLRERIALRYLEEILFGKIEAYAIPLIKVFAESSSLNSPDAEDLLLRICTEVVLGHIRESDENGERDWEGFEVDLNRIFMEGNLSPSFIGRRNELLGLLKEKSTYISTLEKYPVDVLKRDLLQFVHDKKARLNKTFIDQLLCDVNAGGQYTYTSFLHNKHASPTGEECITDGRRKRFDRETTLECGPRSLDGYKRLKHGGNDDSLSNIKMMKECMIRGHKDSENSFQKEKSIDTRIENLSKDIQENKGNDSPDVGSREVNYNRNEETLLLSDGNLSTSNGHAHSGESTDYDVQGLDGQVSVSEEKNSDAKSRTETEELPEPDHLLLSSGCPEQSCFKCRKRGALTYCDGCSIAAHDKCLHSDATITMEEKSGCPVCSYKKALVAYNAAKKEALESKKRLLAFIDIKAAQCNGHKSQERRRHENEISPDKENASKDSSSHPTRNLDSQRKELPSLIRSSETEQKNEIHDEIGNDHQFMHYAYDSRHDGDCEASNAKGRRYSLRQRKSPIGKSSMRDTFRMPAVRRTKLLWTKAEEEILKACKYLHLLTPMECHGNVY